MGIFVNSSELLKRGVGVDLGCLEALMPQQLADAFKSGIMVEQ